MRFTHKKTRYQAIYRTMMYGFRLKQQYNFHRVNKQVARAIVCTTKKTNRICHPQHIEGLTSWRK